MGFTTSGIWTPEEGDKGKPHIYLATMAQSIEDTIGARLAPLEYDSGWIDVTVNAPFEALNAVEKPQVRRVGKMVRMRGGIKNVGVTANMSANDVLIIPLAFRPPVNHVIRLGTSNGAQSATSNVTVNGSCTLRTNGAVASYYNWVTGWFID